MGSLYHEQQDIKVEDCRVCVGPDRGPRDMKGWAVREVRLEKHSVNPPLLLSLASANSDKWEWPRSIPSRSHSQGVRGGRPNSRSQGPNQAG